MAGSAQQRTIGSRATVSGISLFTARPSDCIIRPAPIDHGVVFVRDGIQTRVGADAICRDPVHPAFATIPPRCSAVGTGDSSVWLVEHVLSAIAGLGITNALIEVDHRELPIMDGSSIAFVESIRSAGVVEQGADSDAVRIDTTIRVEQGDSWVEATPAESTSYEYTIDYGEDSPIAQATVRWDGDPDDYADRIAPARTFCLKHEAEMLQSAGLFTHLDEGDMLVLDEDGPIGTTLRDPRECAHHKLLDLIGDMALIGKPVLGRIKAHKSGHSMAHELVEKIAQSQ